MTIEGTLSQFKIMGDRAEFVYPDEGCGVLLGTLTDAKKTIVEAIPTENSWNGEVAAALAQLSGTEPRAANKERSFSIDPRVLLHLQKQARDRGLNIIGFFHSHPDAPAIPSEFDRAIAMAPYSYVIISVNRGRAEKVLSWTLDENGQFQSEPLFINE
ncbi:MAG: M67 family metallopeptidase [Cyanobacteriota bacterium]|nr:M67 family metallopeptidase [Cyanobacteriota bacterium]